MRLAIQRKSRCSHGILHKAAEAIDRERPAAFGIDDRHMRSLMGIQRRSQARAKPHVHGNARLAGPVNRRATISAYFRKLFYVSIKCAVHCASKDGDTRLVWQPDRPLLYP